MIVALINIAGAIFSLQGDSKALFNLKKFLVQQLIMVVRFKFNL
jgi:hypothetical protein